MTSKDSSSSLKEFQEYRRKMNEIIYKNGNMVTKRFFNLDGKAYESGVLDIKTKELLGLVASTVLRCDDCITYHIVKCVQENLIEDEFFEVMNIALIVGGSIVIPHFRRAVETFYECKKLQSEGKKLDIENMAEKKS